ncbi:hypothetical protein SAMN06272737_13347 [Blastococcus mobilis]|uniref:Uncharacterized protein n=1 Tax=Blastococcus mobilis TaxID=1938746 RepID=A0A238ZUZ4_9ACTN|nr:hypothetical protein SAMN06272737_13347 [Blastococcus mobilis]
MEEPVRHGAPSADPAVGQRAAVALIPRVTKSRPGRSADHSPAARPVIGRSGRTVVRRVTVPRVTVRSGRTVVRKVTVRLAVAPHAPVLRAVVGPPVIGRSGRTVVRRVTVPRVTVRSGRTVVRRVTALTVPAVPRPSAPRARGTLAVSGRSGPNAAALTGTGPSGRTVVRRVTVPRVTVRSGRTVVRRVTALTVPAVPRPSAPRARGTLAVSGRSGPNAAALTGTGPSGRTVVRRVTVPRVTVRSGRTVVRRVTDRSGPRVLAPTGRPGTARSGPALRVAIVATGGSAVPPTTDAVLRHGAPADPRLVRSGARRCLPGRRSRTGWMPAISIPPCAALSAASTPGTSSG